MTGAIFIIGWSCSRTHLGSEGSPQLPKSFCHPTQRPTNDLLGQTCLNKLFLATIQSVASGHEKLAA